MDMIIREYTRDDAEEAAVIWNHIVEEGIAFPQTDCLTKESADAFFSEQSFTGTAFDRHSGAMVGLYILHPNNVGAVRPHLQCQLCCEMGYEGPADRGEAGAPLHGKGKGAGLWHPSV